jgi:hypothetical protein
MPAGKKEVLKCRSINPSPEPSRIVEGKSGTLNKNVQKTQE